MLQQERKSVSAAASSEGEEDEGGGAEKSIADRLTAPDECSPPVMSIYPHLLGGQHVSSAAAGVLPRFLLATVARGEAQNAEEFQTVLGLSSEGRDNRENEERKIALKTNKHRGQIQIDSLTISQK